MPITEVEIFRVREHGRAMLGNPLFTYDDAIKVIRDNFAEGSFGGDASVEFAFTYTHGNILRLLSEGGIMTRGGILILEWQNVRDSINGKLLGQLDRVKAIRGNHHQICTGFGLPKLHDPSRENMQMADTAALTLVAKGTLEFMHVEQEHGRIVVSPPDIEPYYFNELYDLATSIARRGFELGDVEKPYLLSAASVGRLAALSVIHEYGGIKVTAPVVTTPQL